MKKILNRFYQSGYFYQLVTINCIVVACAAIWCLFSCLKLHEKIEHEKSVVATKLTQQLETLMARNEANLKYLGDLITRDNLFDAEDQLATLLSSLPDLNVSSYAGWATPDGDLIITGKYKDVRSAGKTIRDRHFFSTAREQPGMLHTSCMGHSLFSKNFVLFTALGVANADNQFKGYLVSRLRIDDVLRELKSIMPFHGYEFILHQSCCNRSVAASNHIISRPLYVKEDVNFVYNGVHYDRFEEITRHNLYVIVGIDQKAFWSNTLNIIYPKLFICFVILVASTCLFLVFDARVVQPALTLAQSIKSLALGNNNIDIPQYSDPELAQLSSALRSLKELMLRYNRVNSARFYAELSHTEKENYYCGVMRRIKQDMSNAYDCLTLLQQTGTEDITSQKLLGHAIGILKKSFDENTPNNRRSLFDLNAVIEEALSFYARDIFEQEIKLKKLLDKELPLYYGDFLNVKSLLIEMIHFCINKIVSDGEISLVSSHTHSKSGNTIHVVLSFKGKMIQYNGDSGSANFSTPLKNFYASQQNIINMAARFGIKCEFNENKIKSTQGFSIEFPETSQHKDSSGLTTFDGKNVVSILDKFQGSKGV